MSQLHIKMMLVLLLPLVVLLGWTGYLSLAMHHRTEITLPVTGYDPRDLLSGHYIRYQIEWQEVDCPALFGEKTCPVAAFAPNTHFYVPEKDAAALEHLLQAGGEHTFEIVFAYQKGKAPLAKQLLVDGLDWHHFLINKKGK